MALGPLLRRHASAQCRADSVDRQQSSTGDGALCLCLMECRSTTCHITPTAGSRALLSPSMAAAYCSQSPPIGLPCLLQIAPLRMQSNLIACATPARSPLRFTSSCQRTPSTHPVQATHCWHTDFPDVGVISGKIFTIAAVPGRTCLATCGVSRVCCGKGMAALCRSCSALTDRVGRVHSATILRRHPHPATTKVGLRMPAGMPSLHASSANSRQCSAESLVSSS